MNRYLFSILLCITTAKGTTAQNRDTISIENVNVISMVSEKILRNQRVLVADGKIVKIESALLLPHNTITQKIDGRNQYLIPGLSEMHYHLRSNDIQSDFKLLIANGITTVRNMAEWPGQDHINIRMKVLSGELFGPRYFTTGPYLKSQDLLREEDVINVVKFHEEKKYDFLKIADNLPKNIYLKLLRECERNGVQIIGHAQRALPVEYSMRMKSIEHLEEFLYLSDTGKGLKFFKEDKYELNKLALKLKSAGVYVGTTLVVFDFIMNCLDDKKFAALRQDDLVKYLARNERESFLTEKNDYRLLKNRVFDGVKAKDYFKANFRWMKAFSKTLSVNGVKLLTGSDTYGMLIVGFSLHKEFELLQQSGLKPFDILLASTVNAARYLNIYSTEGTIAAGKNANLVLLKKNPLRDIKNTKSIQGVMLKGKWISRIELDQMLKEVEIAYR